jgi:hypothetical protein
MDAMHTTLQTIATLLNNIAQGQTQSQLQLATDSKSQLGAEAITLGTSPPLSLITPPLPPTTVETLSETAPRNDRDHDPAAFNSGAQSASQVATGGNKSKQSGVLEGLGKLFYLRS